MELKTCEYCGTAYDARLRQCPLCGRAAAGQTGSAEPERTAAAPEKAAQSAPAPERPAPGRRLRQEPGAPKAARGYAGKRLRTGAASKPSDVQSTAGASPYAIPKWTMIVLCVILGAAVLGGALLAFSRCTARQHSKRLCRPPSLRSRSKNRRQSNSLPNRRSRTRTDT